MSFNNILTYTIYYDLHLVEMSKIRGLFQIPYDGYHFLFVLYFEFQTLKFQDSWVHMIYRVHKTLNLQYCTLHRLFFIDLEVLQQFFDNISRQYGRRMIIGYVDVAIFVTNKNIFCNDIWQHLHCLECIHKVKENIIIICLFMYTFLFI